MIEGDGAERDFDVILKFRVPYSWLLNWIDENVPGGINVEIQSRELIGR